MRSLSIVVVNVMPPVIMIHLSMVINTVHNGVSEVVSVNQAMFDMAINVFNLKIVQVSFT